MVWGSVARAVGRAFSRSGAGRAATRRIITSSKSYARRISSGARGTLAKTTGRVGSAYRYAKAYSSRRIRGGSKKTGLGARRRRIQYEYAYKY